MFERISFQIYFISNVSHGTAITHVADATFYLGCWCEIGRIEMLRLGSLNERFETSCVCRPLIRIRTKSADG